MWAFNEEAIRPLRRGFEGTITSRGEEERRLTYRAVSGNGRLRVH
jgi:hypothetical protein